MREETRLIYRVRPYFKRKKDYSEKIVFNLRFCLPKNHYLVLMEDYEIKLFFYCLAGILKNLDLRDC